MATESETDYFPSLDKCLAGNDRLISWKTAYRSNFQLEIAITGSPAYRFLESKDVENILANALYPFPPPSPATKGEFETKTAPIHVAQATGGEYNWEEIKGDALWLSKETQIGELHALRIAILEWQERPADQLLRGAAGVQSITVASQNFGSSVLSQSTTNFLASTNGAAKPTFDAGGEDARRGRLLRILLEEKDSILKICVDNGVAKDFRNEDNASEPWVDCHECIKFIRDEFSEEASSKDPQVFKSDPTKQTLLLDSKARRLMQVLRALLSRTYASAIPNQAKLVHEWFELMDQIMFLQDPQYFTLEQELSPINCLISLVSLSMLSLPLVISQLEDSLSSLAQSGVQYPNIPSSEDNEYFTNEPCMKQVQSTLEKAANHNITVASPSVYAWSLITARVRDMANMQRSQRERPQIQDGTASGKSSDNSGIWEQRFANLQAAMTEVGRDAQEDPPLFFAQAAVDAMNVYALIVVMGNVTTSSWDSTAQPGTAFESRYTLFSLLRESLAVVPYSSDVLEAILAVFGSDQTGESTDVPFSHLLARTFLDDDEHFRPRVLTQALVRYPYELSPMLRLLTKLASASALNPSGPPVVVQILDRLQRLTTMVPVHFRSYRLESEDEGSNEMLLTDTLQIFRQRQASFFGSSSGRPIGNGEHDRPREVISIPSGASGMIVKEEPPRVLSLSHPHSGLEYLGLILATRLPNSEFVPAMPESALDRVTAAEVVSLINAVLSACLRQRDGTQEAILVLEALSTELTLHGQQGIVPVVADTFEIELLTHLDQTPEDGSLDLAIACSEFFNILSRISPEKVWSMLSRSSLLGANGGASALAAVVGGAEVPMGQYRFLSSCVRLYSSLIDDAVSGLVKRKGRAKRSTNRFDTPTDGADSTPDRAMKTVLLSYQRVVLDAFQNLNSIKFASPEEKQLIASSLTGSFTKMLRWTYGLQDPINLPSTPAHELKDKISSVFAKPAEMILQVFGSEGSANPIVGALGHLLSNGLEVADADLPPQLTAPLNDQVRSTCRFAATLVRTARIHSPKSAAKVSTGLLRGMTIFATLYAAEPSYKGPISALLGELVQAVSNDDADPVSILAPLSAEASQSFLSIVSQLDRPLCDEDVEAEVWDFLATVLGGRQQWFAIYLLTGSLPKTKSKESATPTKAKSLLTLALDELTNISLLAPERAKAMLKFVAVAQNVWIWATNDIRSKTEFLQKAVDFLQSVNKNASKPNTSQVLMANELQMAALLCDIFAVNLHAGLETGDKTLLKLLKDNMAFFAERAAITDAYNRSLHIKLAENLKNKYAQCDLADFKRTATNPAPYGDEFYYDLELAIKVLGHDPAWDPGAFNERNVGRGFVDELRRANINLSLVDAEMNLLASWKTLSSTLCDCVEQESSLQASLAKSAMTCLKANADANLEVPGTVSALKSRAELAFGIISKLVAIKSSEPAMKDLLNSAWDLVNTSPVDYDIATAQEDLQYYRLLIQILFLSIQPHAYMTPTGKPRSGKPASATDESEIHLLSPRTGICLVEIVRKTISTGFRALCGNLHSNLQLALPGDFALMTGLLQAVLSVHGITTVHPQIAEVIANSSVVRGALSLFSWADQLAEVMSQDPIYGEISMTFLLSLSSVRPIAEQMALDGILPQLANANLSNYFRKPGGKGPFDGPRRMFSIWNQGFLPLCLNLLDAVGPPMAAEVTVFLNSFPDQLKRAESSLQPTIPSRTKPHAGDVTLGLLTEAHTLLVIGRILQSDAARGAADGVNAAEIPPLELKLNDIRGNLAALPRTTRSLTDKIVATNEREAAWAMMSVTGSTDNLLVQKVHREMNEAIAVFGPGDN